jgi:hypothetical protein
MVKARAAKADSYAEEAYGKAAELAAQADTECREQDKRISPLRSYSRSRDLHRQARAQAEESVRQSRLNQGMVRQEALNSRFLAIQAVEDARTAIVRAGKEKGEGAIEDLAGSLEGLRRAKSEMESRLAQGDYLAARDLGTRIVTESTQLQASANRRTLGLPSTAAGTDRLY